MTNDECPLPVILAVDETLARSNTCCKIFICEARSGFAEPQSISGHNQAKK